MSHVPDDLAVGSRAVPKKEGTRDPESRICSIECSLERIPRATDLDLHDSYTTLRPESVSGEAESITDNSPVVDNSDLLFNMWISPIVTKALALRLGST